MTGSSFRRWHFFFNDTATTEIYTLSLHDALPIFQHFGAIGLEGGAKIAQVHAGSFRHQPVGENFRDRKSTRLNSSHDQISYAVFCLKKKNKYGERRHSQPSHGILCSACEP